MKKRRITIGSSQKQFVNKHLITDITPLVEYALKYPDSNTPFKASEVENLFCYFSDSGKMFDERAIEKLLVKKKKELTNLEKGLFRWGSGDFPELDRYFRIERQVRKYETLAYDRKAVASWWLVTPVLGRELRRIGEPMLRQKEMEIWGCGIADGRRMLEKLLKRATT